MKKNILLTLVMLAITIAHTPLLAQNAATEKKLSNLINTLDNTQFIKDYKTYKSEVEGLVTDIKLSQGDAKEIAKAKFAYNQSKSRFDAILDQLKRDLANSSTLKLITKSPDVFSQNYQKRLDESKVYCNDNFKKKAANILKTYSANTETIELIIGSFFTIFKSFSEKKAATDEFSVQYLEINLIDPLRFKAWEKIE